MITIESEGVETLDPGIDISEIQQAIVQSVQKALDLIAAEGIRVPTNIRILHVVGDCALDPMFALRANPKVDFETLLNQTAEYRKSMFLGLHGIQMSDEALAEFKEYMRTWLEKQIKSLKESYPNEFRDDVDMWVYGMELPDFEWFVHEIMHLIEGENGILDPSALIHEGTATYAQKRLTGNYRDIFEEGSVQNVLYDMASNLVKEELVKEGNNFALLLNPDFRKRVSERFGTELSHLYFQRAKLTVTQFEREQFLKEPIFEGFRKNPTRDSLIDSFRVAGLNRFADDLEGQDISDYLESLKRLMGALTNTSRTSSITSPH